MELIKSSSVAKGKPFTWEQRAAAVDQLSHPQITPVTPARNTSLPYLSTSDCRKLSPFLSKRERVNRVDQIQDDVSNLSLVTSKIQAGSRVAQSCRDKSQAESLCLSGATEDRNTCNTFTARRGKKAKWKFSLILETDFHFPPWITGSLAKDVGSERPFLLSSTKSLLSWEVKLLQLTAIGCLALKSQKPSQKAALYSGLDRLYSCIYTN